MKTYKPGWLSLRGPQSLLRNTRLRLALLVGGWLGLTTVLPAQTAGGDTPYTVVDRGAFYRVWQKTVSTTNGSTGQVTQEIQAYTELGDGMHYWNGDWIESRDLIDLTPSGAEAVHGQMRGRFEGDITSIGAIQLTTAGGDVFASRPLGLYYFDSAANKVARIAPVQSGQAILYPPKPDRVFELALRAGRGPNGGLGEKRL